MIHGGGEEGRRVIRARARVRARRTRAGLRLQLVARIPVTMFVPINYQLCETIQSFIYLYLYFSSTNHLTSTTLSIEMHCPHHRQRGLRINDGKLQEAQSH